MIFLKQELFIADQRFQLQVRHQKQLVEEGPGYLISFCDFRPFAVDTLMQPREHDDMDTRLGLSIVASGKLHCVASSW